MNSKKQPTMVAKTTTALSLAVLIALAGGIATAHSAEDPATPWRQFEFMGKVVTVQPELGQKGLRSYEVLATENGLAVARLSVNRNGVLSNAWKTDLDGDGNPEIVVIVGQLQGGNTGSADIHEWDGYKFASVRAMQNIPSQGAAYDGHDQYKIEGGKLIREFPRFSESAGSKVPTGAKAKFSYDMQSGQWMSR